MGIGAWATLGLAALAAVAGCASGTAVAVGAGEPAVGAEGGSGGGIDVPAEGGAAPCDAGSECVCVAGESEACYSGPDGTLDVGLCAGGTRSCVADGEFGVWGPCEGEQLPAEELCDNGLDEDCDGNVDEECSCETSDEVCDGLDNDCDGQVDEALVMPCVDTCDYQTCVAGSWTACGAGNVVYDESFESAAAPQEGIDAPASLASFMVLSGDVDAMTDPSGFFGPAHTGAKAIDLNGWGPGKIASTIATVPGETYLLTFAFTKNPSPAVTWTVSAKVRIDGVELLNLQPSTPNSYSNLEWACAGTSFVATGAVATLEIESTNTGNGGVYLDSFLVKEE